LRALEPDTQLTRKLGGLTEARRRLVDDRTRLVNQMHSRLKTYYPLAETLLNGRLTTPMAAAFLARWPDLADLQKADPKTVRAFFYQQNSRGAKKMEARLATVKSARPLTEDAAIIIPARHLVTALAGMLKALHQAIADLDQAITEAFDQHPDAALFRSLPGAGPALAPRLLAAFGTRRDRFASAAEVAQFYGIAPVVKQSGTTKTTHMRSRCPKFGRQTFHENAACAFKKEPWAKHYYEGQKGKPEGRHHKACRAVAYKLIRIYYACWKNNTPYDGQRYRQALEKHASPLHAKLQNPTAKKSE
jgi:transposase